MATRRRTGRAKSPRRNGLAGQSRRRLPAVPQLGGRLNQVPNLPASLADPLQAMFKQASGQASQFQPFGRGQNNQLRPSPQNVPPAYGQGGRFDRFQFGLNRQDRLGLPPGPGQTTIRPLPNVQGPTPVKQVPDTRYPPYLAEPIRGFNDGPGFGPGAAQLPGADRGGPRASNTNPNQFLAEGYEGSRDPTQHIRFWEARGWRWNPNTGQFRWTGKGPMPGSPDQVVPPPTPNPTEPSPGQGQPGTGGGPGGGVGDAWTQSMVNQMGLPLDPAFIAAQRSAEDMLTAQLSQLGVARGQIAPERELFMQRLGTQQGLDTDLLNEQLVGRGLYGASGIADTEQQRLAANFDRSREDRALADAAQLRGFDAQTSEAYLSYQRAITEALMDLYSRSIQNPGWAVPSWQNPVGGRSA